MISLSSKKNIGNILIILSIVFFGAGIYSTISFDKQTDLAETNQQNDVSEPNKEVVIPSERVSEDIEKTDGQFQRNEETKPMESNTQIIIDGISYGNYIENEATVINLMHNTKGIEIETTDYGLMGEFIHSINGTSNDTKLGYYWILYLNNQKSNVGASSAKVEAGDVIEWKYEKSYD
jgi:hypothetical protein